MDLEFWRRRWQEGETSWHLNEVNPLLRQHWEALGVAGGTVLVPLCGASLDLGWLLGLGLHVIGIELSEIGVARAFAHAGLTPQYDSVAGIPRGRAGRLSILNADIFTVPQAAVGKVDAVYDRAALIALGPDVRPRYVAHVATLAPAVPHLVIALEHDGGREQGPPFSVPEAEVRELYSNCGTIELLARVDLDPQQHGAAQRAGWRRLAETVYHVAPRV